MYDEDGDLITSSEELYNSELEWSFRGFESGIVETAPKTYFVAVKVVDEYDKEFMTDQAQFNVYYPVEAGLVPLDVKYDCKEQGISVIAQAPVYVGSTDRDGQTSIDSSNLNGGVLNIPANRIANYEYVLGANKVPINITNTFNFYTQFQITYDFVNSIPDGGETTVLEVGHKSKDGTSIDVLSLRLGSGNSYYVDADGNIKLNTNLLNLKWYKNNVLQSWMIKTNDPTAFNVKDENPYSDITTPSKLQYALVANDKIKLVKQGDLTSIPDNADLDKIWCYQGNTAINLYGIDWVPNYVYKYNQTKQAWEYYTDIQFIFAESLTQLPDGANTYDSFGVDTESQLGDNNIGFGGNTADDNETWVDSSSMVSDKNEAAFNSKWFDLYLKIDNEGEIEQASCEIRITNERRIS